MKLKRRGKGKVIDEVFIKMSSVGGSHCINILLKQTGLGAATHIIMHNFLAFVLLILATRSTFWNQGLLVWFFSAGRSVVSFIRSYRRRRIGVAI